MLFVCPLRHRRGRTMTRRTGATSLFVALTTVLLFLATASWAADDKDQSDIEKRIQNAANVLDEIMAVKDKGIPDERRAPAGGGGVGPPRREVARGCRPEHR